MVSCKGTDTLIDKEDVVMAFGVKAIVNPKYEEGGNVVLILENTSDTTRYIFDPSRLYVERMLDSVWYEVPIQHCRCGAPCAPPNYLALAPFDQMDLSWNQKSSWCQGDSNEPGSDKSEYVKRGTYRIVIRVNDSPEKDQVDDRLLYANFKIL